jgi:hypothetical protein
MRRMHLKTKLYIMKHPGSALITAYTALSSTIHGVRFLSLDRGKRRIEIFNG